MRTNREIFRLFGHQYMFICNDLTFPYESFVGVDDDSKSFAQACSYKKRGPRVDEVDKAQKGKVNHSAERDT